MRFSTILNVGMFALVVAPAAFAQPLVHHELNSRELAHETAFHARQLESYISEMIERRASAGEDTVELEARLFPLLGGLRLLGKGIKGLSGMRNGNSDKKN
ncbi:hypothetical protein DXG01_009252 [Tephrocybe rancida]|nr:hypothetical protein DXG01_009252 [Tephrocybe rancida]